MTIKIDIEAIREPLDQNYILVLTTNTKEQKAVQRQLMGVRDVKLHFVTPGCSIGLLRGQFIVVARGNSGTQGDQTISKIATAFLSRPTMPRPRLIAIVGFGWGNPKEIECGDVVATTEIWAVNRLEQIKGVAKRKLVQRLSTLGDVDDAVSRLHSNEVPWTVRTGQLLSAEAYIADSDWRDYLLADFPHAIGGEMEAFSVVGDVGQIPWIIVKGISDHAGEDTNRDLQDAAAAKAAQTFSNLLPQLEDRLLEVREDAATKRVVDALIGDGFTISATDMHGPNHVYLNDVIGPNLLAKLDRYSIDKYEDFPRWLANVLLEICLNAAIHGRSTKSTISFYETSIVLRDDGRPFKLEELVGEHGGAMAFRHLKSMAIDDGLVTVKCEHKSRSGNIYRFSFGEHNARLRNARENCPLRTRELPPGPRLPGVTRYELDPQCEYSYLDVSRTLMTSKHLDILDDLAEFLEAGKGLFIACHNQTDVQMYEDALRRYAGPKLRVFVRSRIG